MLTGSKDLKGSKRSKHIRGNKRYLCASLSVVLLTVFVDQWYFDEPIPKQEASSHQQTASISNASESISFAPIPIEQALPSMSFNTRLQLPTPPSQNARQHEEKPESLEYDKPSLMAAKNDEAHVSNKSENSEKLIKQRLTQMTGLTSHALQLRFPRASKKTQQIIQYMHQCVGIDIGAIKNQQLMRITHRVQQQSPMLRLSSGAQSTHEKSLMLTYAKGFDLVRIYPYWFDQKLSQYIHRALGQLPLTQLSGEYMLKGTQLWLRSVTVNQQPQSDWLLSNTQICGA